MLDLGTLRVDLYFRFKFFGVLRLVRTHGLLK